MARLPATEQATILRIEIVLRDVEPWVRRVVEVPGEATLAFLHDLVQSAMGWDDKHLHEFDVAGVRYGPLDPDDDAGTVDEATVTPARLLSVGDEAGYAYDFGDGWHHVLTLDAVTAPEPGVRYPRCVEADGACPPEDVGGPVGYADFVDAVTDPAHPERAERLAWSGADRFDPHRVDLPAVDRRLERLR